MVLKTLALETSGSSASIALLEAGRVLREAGLPRDLRSAQGLAPLIRGELAAAGWQASELGLIAVTNGPGSFTGLRVGVTTAKSLAYALKCEVLGIDTLEVLAAQSPAEVADVWTVMDAQRQQLFVARYRRDASGRWQAGEPAAIQDVDRWLELLQAGDYVIGPALGKLTDRIPEGVIAAQQALWEPRAATVGQLALRGFEAGRREDLWHLAPIYLRESAAEEKLK